VYGNVQDSQLVIEQYKTGFLPPGDVPFEDLSVTGVSVTAGNSAVKTDTVRGTVTGRTRRRTGLRALFNPARVSCFTSCNSVSYNVNKYCYL